MPAIIRIFVSLTLTVFSVAGTAGEMDEPVDEQALVILDYDGLFVGAPTAANLVVMNVRVFNGDNQLVFSERSKGEPVNLLAIDLRDGEYSYEIVSVLSVGAGTGNDANTAKEASRRANGRFTIKGHEVSDGYLPSGESIPYKADQAFIPGHGLGGSVRTALGVLTAWVSFAHASDLTASSSEPTLTFDDTDVAGTDDWALKAVSSSQFSSFVILNRAGGNNFDVFQVDSFPDDGSTLNSIAIDSDGDIHWANGLLHFDKGIGALSIGTQAIGGDLTIGDHTPDIRMMDETGQQAEWQLANDQVTFFGYPIGGPFHSVFRYDVNAPDFSLDIAANGNIGLGTSNPSKALDIRRSGGNGAINIINTSGAAAGRTLFLAKNKGAVKVELKNTQSGNRWQVVNTGNGGLKFNETKNSGNEFALKNNGNAVLGGVLTENSDVHAKRDIEPVDRAAILARIAALPIAEWSYKDAPKERHVGPMAQDFHAAFGLGRSDRHIATLDSSGIALAGIQALVEENALLRDRVARLEKMVARLADGGAGNSR